MAWPQWEHLVARINASWPDQQIEPLTAGEWYDDLAHLDPELLGQAVRNLRREHDYRPALAALLREVGQLRANLPQPSSSRPRVDHDTFRQILMFDPAAQNTPAGVNLSDHTCIPNQTRAEEWLKFQVEQAVP
jgi:hypothetical protein